jgi:hypothetical protein
MQCLYSIGVESDGKRVLSSEGCRSQRREVLGIAIVYVKFAKYCTRLFLFNPAKPLTALTCSEHTVL